MKNTLNRCVTVAAFVLGVVALGSPAAASTPCYELARVVQMQAGAQLNLQPISPQAGINISAGTPVTATIVPASGTDLSYCQVVFQLLPAITIEVGLPLNTSDGGTGGVTGGCGVTSVTNNKCVQGNWNGRIDAIGNGGYSGTVPAVTSATDFGFVGSSTDNGHSDNWCNAINPETGVNAQPNCGTAGGGFVLAPNNNLITQQVTDFIDTSLVDQTHWATALAEAYYGERPARTYWTGCSTGGRQGMQMAQFHPELFDGILAGSPAYNWNRFIDGSIWFPLSLADVDPADCPGGTAQGCNPPGGSSAAFQNAYTAANNAAVAACAGPTGAIAEPRRCTFDARSLIGQQPPPMTSPMTKAQAQAIDMIWDGPRNQRGERLWGGIARGTQFFVMLIYGLELNSNFPLYWVEQNPNFNIVQDLNPRNFSFYFQEGDRKFADTTPPPPGFVVPAATDSTNLDALIAHGTKLIHYRGSADPLIVPFGSWNYDTRLFQRYTVPGTEQFYRSFYYPGNGHCGGTSFNTTDGLLGGGNYPNAGMINATDLFNALIGWVENGTAPDSIVAYTQPDDTGNTTLICHNPNTTVYKGGPTTSASSYACTRYDQEPPDLVQYDQTAQQYYEAP
jgi:hypothetical protein